MGRKLVQFSDVIGRVWCGLMHQKITWPVRGRYRCRTCWREYEVVWENEKPPTRSSRGGAMLPSRAGGRSLGANGGACPA